MVSHRHAGHMTGCPSYVAVTVIDNVNLEELFRYDALVLCPPFFTITLTAPLQVPPSSRDQHGGHNAIHTFEVRLSDPARTHSVFLTYMKPWPRDTGITDDDSETVGVVTSDTESETVVGRRAAREAALMTSNESALFTLLACLVLVSICALMVTLVHADPSTVDGIRRLRSPLFSTLCCQPSTGSHGLHPYSYSYCNSYDNAQHRSGVSDCDDDIIMPPIPVPPPPNISSSTSGFSARTRDDSACRKRSNSAPFSSTNIRLLVFVYAVVWVVYSLAATFTTVSLAISALVHSDVDQMTSALDSFRSQCNSDATNWSVTSAIDLVRQIELRRQVSQLMERHEACTKHVDRMYTSWAKEIATGPCTYCRPVSKLENILQRRYTDRVTKYKRALGEYEIEMKRRLDEALRISAKKYTDYLQAVANNPWTTFMSTGLFNGTLVSATRRRHTGEHITDDGVASRFSAAFEVDEVTAVGNWVGHFWQR